MTAASRSFVTRAALGASMAVIAALGLLTASSARAQGWYNASWAYRRAVAVANAGATRTDYQVRITLDATNFDFGLAKSDGSDIRLAASDGTTLLPFWMETWNPTGSQALMWVRAPSIPATSGTTLYVYYGNASATGASNGTTTFPLFDDSLWTTSTGNPVFTASQSWWETVVSYPIVFKDPSLPGYQMLYDGHSGPGVDHGKGYATSPDLVHWTEYDNGLTGGARINPIMAPGYAGNASFAWGDVIKANGVYHMFPSRGPGTTVHTQSTDLIHWTGFETLSSPADGGGIGSGVAVLKQPDGITPVIVDGKYWMVYFHGFAQGSMYLASADASSNLLTWTTCCSTVPILAPSTTWDANGLWTPSFVKVDNSYYIYYQGSSGTYGWSLGFAKGAAVSGGNPVRPDNVTWTKSTNSVVTGTHGWDNLNCQDPVLRQFNGTYYLFYTGCGGPWASGFCTSTSPEGPWTPYVGSGVGWTKSGSLSVSNSILSIGNASYIKSPGTYSPGVAIGMRARYYNDNYIKWGGFINGTSFPGLMVETTNAGGYGLYLVTYDGAYHTVNLGAPPGTFHVYEDAWVSSSLGKVFVDNSTTATGSVTTAVPSGALPVEFYNYSDASNTYDVDWVYLRTYAEPEPTNAVGTRQNLCGTITLSPPSLPAGVVGTAYSEVLSASGGTGPYTFAVTSGALPAGLNLTNGTISGTPTASGTFSFGVTATDTYGCTGARSYSIVTTCPAVTLSPVAGALPGATTGSGYSQALSASGGTAPYTFAVTLGALPAGLVLSATGLISGTPTALGDAGFTVRATDTYGCTGTAAYTLNVTCGPITLTPVSLPGGTIGSAYSQALVASGGTGACTYGVTSGALPDGLGLVSGIISGTPTASGTFNFAVTATDANGCTGVGSYSIAVDCPTIYAHASVSKNVSCRGGSDGAVTAAATGGTAPYAYLWQPGGLAGASQTGLGAGTYTVTVTDASGCTGTAQVTVAEPAAALGATETHVNVTTHGGSDGSIDLTVTGGTAPYGYAWTGPGGYTSVVEDPSALLAGTYTVIVTDAPACTTTLSVTLTEPPPGTVQAEPVGGACVSSAHPCIEVPVVLYRNDPALMRGYTVTVALGGGLSLCPPQFAGGSYVLHPLGPFFVDNHDGTYTIDDAASGPFCNPAGTGVLFKLYVTSTAQTGTGTITITAVEARDCLNLPIPVLPGAVASIPIDNVLPATATNVSATQVLQGNIGTGGTTGITVMWTAPSDGASVEVYRAAYGNYPEYDDGTSPGSELPAPPGSRWVATGLTTSPASDLPPTRDYYYYAVKSTGGCGNVAWSEVTGGTLNYHLGDVSDGTTACWGDGTVGMADISLLGWRYGERLGEPGGEAACLDVGPTSTGYIDGRPLTDNVIDFEDLVMLAINWTTGSVQALASRSAATHAAASGLELGVPAMPAVGATFEAVLKLVSAGDVKALSVALAYDPSVVEPVAVMGGALLNQQAGPAQVYTATPGVVDAAVFGQGLTFQGSGELARATFRVKATGDARLAFGTVRARDIRNRPLTLGQVRNVEPAAELPKAVDLAASYPNPFTHSTTIVLGLPKAAEVKLGVYDLQGRLVATLMNGRARAGWTHVTWDGRADSGLQAAPGAYVIRMAADGAVKTRRVALVR